MTLRYALLAVFRSGKKAALFFVLIAIVALFTTLGVSLIVSSDNMIAECEESYKTIALFEYRGDMWPSDTATDSDIDAARTVFAEHSDALVSHEAVKAISSPVVGIGVLEGYARADIKAPYSDCAVLLISVFTDVREQQIGNESYIDRSTAAYAVAAPFSRKDVAGKLIFLSADEAEYYNTMFSEEAGKRYFWASGIYENVHRSYPSFTVADFRPYYEDDDFVPVYQIDASTDSEALAAPVPSALQTLSAQYNKYGNSVEVYITDDIAAEYDFHHQTLYLTQGRDFTADEYNNGGSSAIVTETVARRLNLSLGDSFNMALTAPTPDNGGDIYTGHLSEQNESYTVVGMVNDVSGYENRVWLPRADDIEYVGAGTTVARLTIENAAIDAFIADMAGELDALAAAGITLSVSDQGYAAAVGPVKALRSVAAAVTAVCAAAGMAILLLFGYLFVARQSETAIAMLTLGAGGARIVAHYSLGSGLLALFAAAAGCAAGYASSELTAKLVSLLISYFDGSDLRFSNSALSSGKAAVVTGTAELGPTAFVLSGVLFFAVLFSIFFALRIIHSEKPGAARRARRLRSRRTTAFPGGASRYALLSIARGGARTLVVPILAVASALLLCYLGAAQTESYQKIDELTYSTPLNGRFTGIDGVYANKLGIDTFNLSKFINSGYVDSYTLGSSASYNLLSVTGADGEERIVGTEPLPTKFGAEAYEAFFAKKPPLVMTTSYKNAVTFTYLPASEIEYYDGYDESMFSRASESILVPEGGEVFQGLDCPKEQRDGLAAVSSGFMDKYEILPGDVIKLRVQIKNGGYSNYTFKVVASYENAEVNAPIYTPLYDFFYAPMLSPDNMDDKALYDYSFDFCSFTLANASKLVEFKDMLDTVGFSSVNHIRSVRLFITVDDAVYLGAKTALERHVRYINILYPLIFALVSVVGAVACYLTVAGRRSEIAIMRALGTPLPRIFMSFFIEQSSLCVLGCAAALALRYIIYNGVGRTNLILCLVFAIVYSIGSAFSVGVMCKGGVATLSAARD